MFVISFISQWMKRSKHGLLVFPPKKTLIWRRYCSISQLCCSMTSKRSIHWFLEISRAWSFSPERSLNQPKATRVCICSINQSNRFISVRLLFLFCSRVFISKSYENRSNSWKTDMFQMSVFLHNSYTSHSLTHSHLTNTSPFTNLRVKEFYLVAVWHPIMTS